MGRHDQDFAGVMLRTAFDAARGKDAAKCAAAAAVVAALLPHVEPTERTITEAVATLITCIDDAGVVDALARALTARVRGDTRLVTAVARAARRAFELGAMRSLFVLVDVLLATPEGAALVEEAWGAAAFAALPRSESRSPAVEQLRRRWAEHKKSRPVWLGDVDDELTDLHPASFFRARHAELLAIGATPPEPARSPLLGRYRLLEEIGIGGIGTVHLARLEGCSGFERWAAIKRLHTYLEEERPFVEMFLDEAKLTARISHPNVASVFELGKADNALWMAMEYLHGEPLSEWLQRARSSGRPVPPEIACRVIADAANGLHAAHELAGANGEPLEIVHRDVTPQNLFVTFDGVTKVLDFGFASFGPAKRRSGSGAVGGKLAYMSPEQVRADRLDRRTDVFALGVVLWELTTGRRLFRRATDLDTLSQVVECAPPAPSAIVRGYPDDLERVVLKALAKDRDARFRTTAELARALQATLMRRGLIIGADDVATHTRSMLADRVRFRDALLARHARPTPRARARA